MWIKLGSQRVNIERLNDEVIFYVPEDFDRDEIKGEFMFCIEVTYKTMGLTRYWFKTAKERDEGIERLDKVLRIKDWEQ